MKKQKKRLKSLHRTKKKAKKEVERKNLRRVTRFADANQNMTVRLENEQAMKKREREIVKNGKDKRPVLSITGKDIQTKQKGHSKKPA